MRVISSHWTFFYKRIFPLLWFGFLAFFIISGLLVRDQAALDPRFLLMPAVMAVFGYFVLRALVFDLADEVVDAGDALIVRKAGDEARIALADIVNVDSSMFMNPPRIVLTLRTPCRFGREIAFSPLANRSLFAPFAPNPTAKELIERVDRARLRG